MPLERPDAQGLIATANMEPVVGAYRTVALLAGKLPGGLRSILKAARPSSGIRWPQDRQRMGLWMPPAAL